MIRPITTKDGKLHNIIKDSDFQQLCREYMGDDAARWYEERLKPYDGIHQMIIEKFPSLTRSLALFLKDLDTLDSDDMWTLMMALDSLRGWDE